MAEVKDDESELQSIVLDVDEPEAGDFSGLQKNRVTLPKTYDWAKNDLKDNDYEKAKFWFFLLSGLALVRLVCFVVILCLAGFIGFLAALGAPIEMDQPWPAWRTRVASPISFLARILLFTVGFHWIEVDDRQKTKGQVVVIAPHTGLMDSFFITWYFLPSPISKASVRNIPVFGSLCIALQTIFVERESSKEGPYSRKKVLETMQLRAKDERFPRMCIFPEGTTNNGGCLMEFKKGAFAPGEPITPILLTYPNEHYNCACSGRNGTDLSLVWCIFQFHNRMKATILDAYVPNEEEKADPNLFARNVRDFMAQELSLPTTEHSYPDLFLQMEGLKFPKQYFYDCNFQMVDVKSQFNLELPDCKVLLRRFADADRDQSGRIEMDDFVTLFHLQTYSKEYRERLFRFFDVDGTGSIEFREFLCAVSIVSEGATVENKLPLAFAFYDKGGRGMLSLTDLNRTFDDAKRLGVVEGDFALSDAVFSEFDKDGDGLLSYEEFSMFVMATEENNKFLDPAIAIVGDYLGMTFEAAKRKVAENEKVRKKTEAERSAREERRKKTVTSQLSELEADGEEVELMVGQDEDEDKDVEEGSVKKEEEVKEMLATAPVVEKVPEQEPVVVKKEEKVEETVVEKDPEKQPEPEPEKEPEQEPVVVKKEEKVEETVVEKDPEKQPEPEPEKEPEQEPVVVKEEEEGEETVAPVVKEEEDETDEKGN
ncbi:hypothetical protein TrST_g12830 [Triparma strigata]|uniref:EF-hand domain-containing protein n=2 Tax=Triparma strigata TaxID=1606541 RepID=A0A9W7B6C9_9STRA|nr:hypothetical protein TrST_g12830 [Triparma strigata]